MRRTLPLLLSVSCLALAAACGSSNNTPTDNGSGDGNNANKNLDAGIKSGDDTDASTSDSGNADAGHPDAAPDAPGFKMAAHADFPQLIDQGGPVLTAPKIVTVTFPNDTNADQLEAFGKTVTSTPWWDSVRAGYCETSSATTCVGPGPDGTAVRITTAPADSYVDGAASPLKTYITGLIKAKTLPAPDANTLYIFYFPKTTTITFGGGTSCTDFGGYHNATTYNGTAFTYAILPECDPQTASLTVLQSVTLAASHEIIEASTDPFQTNTSLGYYLDEADDAHFLPWNDVGGGEAGDMCVDFLLGTQDATLENGFTVQRSWSNIAAKAGGDPCVPKAGVPYFNVAPELKGQFFKVEVGKTFTFTATAFSDSAVAPWIVEGIDLNATQTDKNPFMTITVNGQAKATVNNGDAVQVAVTLKAEPGDLVQSKGGAAGALVSIDAAPPATTAGHLWPFLAYTQADATDAGFALPRHGARSSVSIPRAARAQVLSVGK